MYVFYRHKATPEQPPQGGRLGRAAPGREARAGGPSAGGSGGRPHGGDGGDGGDGDDDGGRILHHRQTPPHHAQGFHTPFGQPLTPT